jgi:hypothetical protein
MHSFLCITEGISQLELDIENSRRAPHFILYKLGIMYSIIRLACLLILHYISVVNSLGVLCLPLCPDKLGTQVSLSSKYSKLRVIFFLDSTFVPWPRNSEIG